MQKEIIEYLEKKGYKTNQQGVIYLGEMIELNMSSYKNGKECQKILGEKYGVEPVSIERATRYTYHQVLKEGTVSSFIKEAVVELNKLKKPQLPMDYIGIAAFDEYVVKLIGIMMREDYALMGPWKIKVNEIDSVITTSLCDYKGKSLVILFGDEQAIAYKIMKELYRKIGNTNSKITITGLDGKSVSHDI